MPNRQQNYTARNQSEDRPRDEYGRFESEYESRFREQRGDRSRDDSRYEPPYEARYDRDASWERPRDEHGRFESERHSSPSYPNRNSDPYRTWENGRDQRNMDSERSRRWDSYEMRDQQFNPDAYRNSGMGASYDRGSWQPSDREQDYSGMRAGNREIRNNGELGGVYDSSRINRSNQGQFAGKGPKGYKRPDERIQEDVNEALSQHPDLDASELEVKVSQGEVVLTGTVSDRHAKRLAEDIAESCSGIQDVRNEIRVQRDHSSDDKESSHQNRKQPAMAGASKS